MVVTQLKSDSVQWSSQISIMVQNSKYKYKTGCVESLGSWLVASLAVLSDNDFAGSDCT